MGFAGSRLPLRHCVDGRQLPGLRCYRRSSGGGAMGRSFRAAAGCPDRTQRGSRCLCRAALSRATSANAKRGSSPPSRSSSRVRPKHQRGLAESEQAPARSYFCSPRKAGVSSRRSTSLSKIVQTNTVVECRRRGWSRRRSGSRRAPARRLAVDCWFPPIRAMSSSRIRWPPLSVGGSRATRRWLGRCGCVVLLAGTSMAREV